MLPLKVYLQHPAILGMSLLEKYFTWLPDKLYLSLMFRFKMGYKLNLKYPKTYSEKLMWLKLNDHKPEYTNLVDKYAVKQHVADLIGEQYVIPTIGVWNKPEDIDWDVLHTEAAIQVW